MANMLIFFAEKTVSSFYKSYSHFCSQNINLFENILASTVNEFVINMLIKLTVLWTTRPSTFWLKKSAWSAAMVMAAFENYGMS